MKFDFTAKTHGPGLRTEFAKGDVFTINLPVQFRSATNIICDNKLLETISRTFKNIYNIDIRPQDVPLYFGCTENKN